MYLFKFSNSSILKACDFGLCYIHICIFDLLMINSSSITFYFMNCSHHIFDHTIHILSLFFWANRFCACLCRVLSIDYWCRYCHFGVLASRKPINYLLPSSNWIRTQNTLYSHILLFNICRYYLIYYLIYTQYISEYW